MHNINFIIIGLYIGSLIGNVALVAYIKHTCGTLNIDRSNPDKDLYRFDIDDLDSLCRKKRIILKVDNHADLSQK